MKKLSALFLLVSILFFGETTLRAQAPTITTFNPASGSPGTAVTLTGTGFNTTASNNIVKFGATKATVSAASATSLTVTVPSGATYEPITVLESSTALMGASQKCFLTTFSPNKGDLTLNDIIPKVDFATTGNQSYYVTIGDLDGDGKPDLAVANFASGTVSVFRNTSSSGAINSTSFAAKVDFTTGANPISVAIGDLDGDGKSELTVVNYGSATISVFRNTASSGTIANSSFAAKVDFTVGTNPRSVAIGDLDGDGKPDLAIANTTSSTVSILRNTFTTIGTISFAAKVDYTTGSAPHFVAIGDLDGDGKADLATANNGSASVSVLRNNSIAGTISLETKVDFTAGSFPVSMAIGDLDTDGKAEMVVTNFGSAGVSVFKNNSVSGAINSTSFASKVDFTTGTGAWAVAIGDLDGDGKPDLAVANTGVSTLSVLRNTSTASSITTSSFAAKVDFATTTGTRSVTIGDLDLDGKPDMVAANYNTASISILRNDPKYSITYDGNINTSGTVPATSYTSIVTAATVSANSGILTKTGYTFSGWNTAANGSGTSYAGSGSATFTINANVILYAKWTPNNYTVTFNANGGTGIMSNQSIAYLASANLTTNAFTRTGYTFAGWATTSGGTVAYANGASYTMSAAANVTLYAKWTLNNYTVSFGAFGGDGGFMPSQSIAYLASTSLIINAYTRVGYTFAGWSTTAGGPIAYADGAIFTMSEAVNVILYANWTANIYYTVTFDANEGTGTMSNQTIAYNESANLIINTFTRTGYTFAGWATTSGGTVAYANGSSYTMSASSNVTLFAKWTANNYIVTFDTNGGTGSMSNQTIAYNASTNLMSNAFTRTGYTFAGWGTTGGLNGTVAYADGASYTMSTSANVTLYALWTPNNYNVMFGPLGGEGFMSIQPIAYLASTSLISNAYTREGYTFAGWSTTAGGALAYADGAVYTMSEATDVILWAKWNCITTVSTTNVSVCANTPTYTWNGIVRNAPGTYTYNTTNSIGCDSVATLNLTVTANNTVSAASSTPSLCINTPLTNITHSTTGATDIGTATGLPAGVTATWANNNITVSGTPTASGTFNYAIPLVGGCGSVNATGTITVSANTAGIASSTPSLCINTPLTNITHITTGATGIALPNAANYTLPSMTPLAISDPLNEVDLVNVTITNNDSTILNNTTIYNSLSGTIGTASGTAGSFSDFTSFGPYNMYPGNTYSFSLSSHNNPNGIDLGGYRNSMAIYIDYNRNGVYTDAGEKVYAASVSSLGPHTEYGSFTIPTSTLRGLTRMRVINKQNPNTLDIITSPTATFLQGEYEEYSIFIGGEVIPGLDISWADNTITISGSPTQTGTFNYSIPLVGGCGNVNATGTITVNSTTSSTTNTTICAQQLPYSWNGGSYTSGGVYTYLTSNAKGCDSLVTLNLTIYQPSSSTNIAICSSQVPYLWNGGSYTASGVYTYHTSNAIGCDSLATLNLTVNQPTSSIQNITTCKPYFFGGTSYTSSGTYTYNTLNAKGCDSLAMLNLTMTTVQYDTTEVTACGSYTWALNNKTYTASGFYTPSIPQVQIGNQVWSSKNLDVATYNNGDSIPEEKDIANWTNLTTGAWIWSGNNSTTGAVYGKLYNLYALTDPRGLLPNGWHLPSFAEWITLSNTLGGRSVAGGKMKVLGTANWITPNTGANNSSGFTGLPGGAVSASGTGTATSVWSLNAGSSIGVWWAGTSNAMRLNNNNALLDTGSYFTGIRIINTTSTFTKYRGLSVRLVKDSLQDCVEHVLKLTILPNATSVSISASSSTTNICSGTSITFTATATDAGNTPIYVWKKNGIVVGDNSNTYTNDNWADSAYVQVFMTSSAGCNTSTPYTSNKMFVYLENSTPDTWKQKATPFGVRDGAVAFSIGNKGYLGLGKVGQLSTAQDYKKDFWQYDPATNVWTQIADYGGDGQINSVGFSIGNKGYVGLGVMKNGSNFEYVYNNNYSTSILLFEYDPSVNLWTRKALFPENTGRYGMAGFSIGNKGYLGLGFLYDNSYSGTNYVKNQFYEYNPTSDTWTRKADFPVVGIRYAVAFNIGSKGYVGTGQKVIADQYVGAPSFSNDFWEYNPATDIWTQKANFGGTARAYAAGFSIGSKGYIGAGDDGVRKNDFWEYNPSTDAWTQMANFGGAARQSAVGFSIGNKGYLGTGNVPNPTTTNTAFNYSTKDIWEYSATGMSTITTSVAPVAQCPASSIAVPYSIGCTAFAEGNVFTAQLSDSIGSFANPVNIGTLSSTASGTINAVIPSSTGFGKNYRIRIISSLPETYGTPNDNYFSIGTAVGGASNTPTVCSNAALTNITHTTINATGIGTATGLPSGVSASWSNDTIKISGTPTDSGTFNYSIPLTGGCIGFTATGTITVKALPEISITGNTTICAGAVSTLTVQSNIIAPTQSIPLDEVAGATLAVGLRRLRTAYTGSALRLRRSSDNGEQDFGFAGNDLDVNAISTWLNGASGYCTKLYDQSGNGGDVSQTSVAAQPLLVISGINNNPSLRFTTTQSMFNAVNYPAPFSVIYGSKVIGTSARVLAAKNNNWLLGYWGGSENRAYFDGWVSEGTTPTVANQYNIYAATGTGSVSTVYKNGTQIASNGNGLTGPNGIQLNGYGEFGNTTETSNCEFTDVIVYGSALSAREIVNLNNSTAQYYAGVSGIINSYLWSTGDTTASISINTVGTYSVMFTNTNGCSATSSVTVKNPSSISNVSICSSATPYVWNGGSYTSSGVYTHTANSTLGCDSIATLNLTINSCTTTLNITTFLEGFYTGNGTMRANLYDLGISTNDTETDSVDVNLWSVANLSSSTPDFTVRSVLHTNGTLTAVFPGATLNNSYYVALKHRNSLEIWSAAPVTIASTTNHDFSSSLNAAFSDGFSEPLKWLNGNKYAMFSGDVNQDGTIDLFDAQIAENGASNLLFGYYASDCNGDASTDLFDMQLIENNSTLLLFYSRPF